MLRQLACTPPRDSARRRRAQYGQPGYQNTSTVGPGDSRSAGCSVMVREPGGGRGGIPSGTGTSRRPWRQARPTAIWLPCRSTGGDPGRPFLAPTRAGGGRSPGSSLPFARRLAPVAESSTKHFRLTPEPASAAEPIPSCTASSCDTRPDRPGPIRWRTRPSDSGTLPVPGRSSAGMPVRLPICCRPTGPRPCRGARRGRALEASGRLSQLPAGPDATRSGRTRHAGICGPGAARGRRAAS